MSNLIYTVYKHTSKTSGKSYIGQTSYSIGYRWLKHMGLSNRASNLHFHRAIRKYGDNDFTHEILFTTDKQSIINNAEIFLIAYYDTFKNGYNMTIGGDGYRSTTPPMLGKTHTEETKDKQRIGKIGKLNPKFSGYYHTPIGTFESAPQATIALGVNKTTITRWCKKHNMVISYNHISQSNYLQALLESPLGKTFREIGFYFGSTS